MTLSSAHMTWVGGTGTPLFFKRGHHAVFTIDLVRRWQQLSGRFLAQDVVAAGRAQEIGGIRLAAFELADVERAAKSRQMCGEIALERVAIDLVTAANGWWSD